MDILKSVTKEGRQHEVVVAVLLIVYILSGVHAPAELSAAVSTMGGKVVVGLLALSSFYVFTPVVAVLFSLAALELLRRAGAIDLATAGNFRGSEAQKSRELARHNVPTPHAGKTLEEEMVQTMAPLVRVDNKNVACSSYKGIVDSSLVMTSATD